MDTDEWSIWKKHLPEIADWLGLKDENEVPLRIDCLDVVENRAFTFTEKTAQRFLAVSSIWPYHKLLDKEIEYLIRIILEFKNGRNTGLVLGEPGRRLLKAAEKKHRVPTGYLNPFREIVLDELD